MLSRDINNAGHFPLNIDWKFQITLGRYSYTGSIKGAPRRWKAPRK